MNELTRVEIIVTIAEMSWVTVIASIIMVKIWFDYRFRFLLLLCLILIVTDISTALLAVGIGMENTNIHVERTLGLASEVGITTFFFNGGTLLLHWLFSFKYWVISLEIPKVLKATGTTLKSSETKYKIYNAIGITVNMLFCVWVAVRRGQLSA